MQACSGKNNYIMVSSVVKPGKNNYSQHSTAMPSKIDSPPALSTATQVVHSKVSNGTLSPPSSPQRVTRSRLRFQKEQKMTTKTQGASSNDATSITNQERLVCPELAINYANTVISSRLGTLNTQQAELESKMVRLSGRLRHKQLQLANSHARKQLDFYDHKQSTKRNNSALSTTDVSDMEVDVTKALPIQVDGASEESTPKCELKTLSPIKAEDSFSSLESSFQEECGLAQIEGRLEFARQLVDEDATDCSSDEETDMEITANPRCENLKKDWERVRTLIGSKWAWLERRISELNKQICHLDYKIQRRPKRESTTFTSPRATTSTAPYLTVSNGGTLLEQIHRSGLKGGNGLSSPFLPQLLLPGGGVSNTKQLQVKDLLASSSLGKKFSLLMEESGDGCARTRPLERRAKRKMIRKTPARGRPKREGLASLDPSYHPKLSLPHELPSRLLLDTPVKQVLQEHAYARQPLSKRRKAACSLTHLFTPRPYKPEPSSSPSPMATPSSASSAISKVNSRRKMYQLTHQSSSMDLFGPISPPTRPDTPSQPPPKKKRALTSTPSFDIDNIVIPYSMAASTRLEKVEYKEIVTPRWREVEKNDKTPPGFRIQPVEPTSETTENADDNTSEEEDISYEAILKRHEKCEQQEQKRFMNFISGGSSGQKKQRNRPSSSSNGTPDPLSFSSPLPFSSTSSRRRGFESPIPSEADLYASQYIGILPWQPRDFPLVEEDIDALTNPPPPPNVVRGLLSPQSFSDYQFKSRTPSIASTLATPLSSPISTPNEETPSISPTEWMVVSSQLNEKTYSYCKPANGSHFVLKLSKRA